MAKYKCRNCGAEHEDMRKGKDRRASFGRRGYDDPCVKLAWEIKGITVPLDMEDGRHPTPDRRLGRQRRRYI